MSNFIEHISINNFKSIKSCQIRDCKRINLFIGRPNVGKSNILEALSLFSMPFLRESSSKKLTNLIRVENEAELFYSGDTSLAATINTNICECTLAYSPKEGLKAYLDFKKSEHLYFVKIDERLNTKGVGDWPDFEPAVKRYTFKPDVLYKKGHAKYLLPPFGSNLFSILENYSELREQVKAMFNEYGLQIAFDKASETIKIFRPNDDGVLFLMPYNSVADTLQRIIFYKAAIASNENSILLFEEPEAHAFPPYMSMLTQEMIYKKGNQYFIATHSPFILNDLLENGRDELAIYTVNYEQNETKVKRLTEGDLHDIYQNGVDLFTNSESFL